MLSQSLQSIADMSLQIVYARNAWRQYRRLAAGGMRVAPADRRRALSYSLDVLGSPLFAPWLLFYSAVSGRFTDGWIPESFYATTVVRRINQPRDAGGAKTLAARILPRDLLPDLAYLIAGSFYDTDYRPLDDEALRRILFADQDRVIAKPEASGGGRGVLLIGRDAFSADSLRTQQANMVFQRALRQHPQFDGYSTAGATIRLTTVIEPDGSSSVRSSYVRLAAPGESLVRTLSANRVPLDLRSGQAVDDSIPPDWRRLAMHPTSGLRFRDLRVPELGAAADRILALHRTLPQFGCIGWDLLIDEAAQPWILEWNTLRNNIAFSEAVTGPSFRGLNWERFARARRS